MRYTLLLAVLLIVAAGCQRSTVVICPPDPAPPTAPNPLFAIEREGITPETDAEKAVAAFICDRAAPGEAQFLRWGPHDVRGETLDEQGRADCDSVYRVVWKDSQSERFHDELYQMKDGKVAGRAVNDDGAAWLTKRKLDREAREQPR